jgi:hypothetical protein
LPIDTPNYPALEGNVRQKEKNLRKKIWSYIRSKEESIAYWRKLHRCVRQYIAEEIPICN